MKNLKPFLIALGVFTASLSVSAQQRMAKTYTGLDEIEITVSSGDIILKKASGKEIKVELEHTFDIEYNPVMRQSGSKLDIDDKNVGREYNNYSGSATWTFYIPDNIEVEFKTGSGNAEIAGLNIEFEMNSGSGDFDMRNSKGEIEISTGSGNIEINDSEGWFRLGTGSGDIDLEDLLAEVNAQTGSGDIEANNIELSERSYFGTGSGDSEVMLAKPTNFDISVSSGSGDASLDFNGNVIEGEIVMTVNKKRGEIRAPFDFDSEEEIDEGRNTKLKKTKKLGDKDVQINVSSGSGTAKISK